MIYVDELVDHSAMVDRMSPATRRAGARYGHRWCHLTADSTAELLAFALRLGMRKEWLQHPGTAREHFDLVPAKRAAAVRMGAIETTAREQSRKVVDEIREAARRQSSPTSDQPGLL